MSSKPTRRKDVLDSIINLKKRQREINGLNRQNFSGLGSSAFGAISGTGSSGSSSSGNSGNNDSELKIKTAGDTMIGPLAFYFQTKYIASGVLDVSATTGAYSSRVVVIGQGAAADDLEVILGAGFAGQILFFQPIQAVTLQSFLKTATAWSSGTSYSIGDVVLYSNQRYTCYVAHTSSGSILPTDKTKWYRNNIRITGATEQVVAVDEIILLQYDSTDGVWTVVSGGGSGGSNLLTSNNNFTGINSFTNASGAFTVSNPTVSLGTNAGNINILGTLQMSANYATFSAMTAPSASLSTTRKLFVDTADNKLKIRTNTGSIDLEAGGAGLGTANVWTNVNTFQNVVNMYGTVNLGDATSDRVNFTAKLGTDIDLNTYDVKNMDRLKFSTTAGSGSALGTSDTGIEAQYSGGSSAGIKFQVPTSNIYQFFSGSTEKVNIGASTILLNSPVSVTGALAMGTNKITGLGTPTSTTDAATKAYVDANSSGGGISLSGNNTWTGTQTFDSANTYVDHDLTVKDNLQVYDDVTINDNLQVDDDVILGSSISDDIELKGRVEWGNSYTASAQSYPGLALGYITIKVNGSNRNIWVS